MVWVGNFLGLRVRQICHKEVDLGWNEVVVGGAGVFEFLLEVGARLLYWFRVSYAIWLCMSFVIVILLVQFSYP